MPLKFSAILRVARLATACRMRASAPCGAGCAGAPLFDAVAELATGSADSAAPLEERSTRAAIWRLRKLAAPNHNEQARRKIAATLPKTISTVGGRLAGMFRISTKPGSLR